MLRQEGPEQPSGPESSLGPRIDELKQLAIPEPHRLFTAIPAYVQEAFRSYVAQDLQHHRLEEAIVEDIVRVVRSHTAGIPGVLPAADEELRMLALQVTAGGSHDRTFRENSVAWQFARQNARDALLQFSTEPEGQQLLTLEWPAINAYVRSTPLVDDEGNWPDELETLLVQLAHTPSRTTDDERQDELYRLVHLLAGANAEWIQGAMQAEARAEDHSSSE